MAGYNFLSNLNRFSGYRQPNPLDPYGEMNASGEEDPFATMPMGTPPPPQNPFNPSLPVEEPEPAGPRYMNSSLNQYRDSLAQQPMQADYRPTKKRIFGGIMLGGLAGMGANNPQMAYNMANSITRQPYNSAMEEWKTTTSGYKQAADIEESQNTHEFNRYIQKARLDDIALDRRNRNEDRDLARGITQQNADTNSRNAATREKALKGGKLLINGMDGSGTWFHNDGTIERVGKEDYQALTFEQQLAMKDAGRMIFANDERAWRESFERLRTELGKERDQARIDAQADAKTETQTDPGLSSTEVRQLETNRVGEFLRAFPGMKENVKKNATGAFELDLSQTTTNWEEIGRLVGIDPSGNLSTRQKMKELFDHYVLTGEDKSGKIKSNTAPQRPTRVPRDTTPIRKPTDTRQADDTMVIEPPAGPSQRSRGAGPGPKRAPKSTKGPEAPEAAEEGDTHEFSSSGVKVRFTGGKWIRQR